MFALSERSSSRGRHNLVFVVQLLLLLLTPSGRADAGRHSSSSPSPDFTEHEIIRPRLYHGREKREVRWSDSAHEDGGHLHHLTLAYTPPDGKEVVLDLQLNRDLLPENYFQKYHHQGKYVINRPKKDSVELCHYLGKVRGRSESWAALSTCSSSVSGVVFDGEELHHVEGGKDDLHYLYRHHHVRNNNRTCGFEDPAMMDSKMPEDLTTPSFFEDHAFNRMLRYRRDISNSYRGSSDQHKSNSNTLGGKGSWNSNIKGPWNANRRSRYVELVIVVDNRKFKENDEDLEKVSRKCKDMANIANALYAPLNIYIALVGVVVWTEYDEIALSTNGDTTLTNFLHYRRERLVKEHPNDNAQLLTGVQFDSGVVGKALKGPMCTYEFSGGVSTWHSDVIGLVATTMAHEMGHNFGMEHDAENCQCPEERCIMSPASSTMKPSFWSSCSLEYLALAFEHGMDYCLRNKPRSLFDSPVCGNGFVEPGEECDCGLAEHCQNNPCCDPATCRLFANATCATGECCDFRTCQPKGPGAVCRLSEHECDLPEYCTGDSEFCPTDIFKVDGTSCKVGEAYCYQGTCRTHSDQCRLLWGPSGKKSDNQCYDQNRKGSRHGNCGYNRLNQSFVPCHQEDVRCGMLHCSHLNERLEFGMESVAILSHSFINTGGRIIPCRTALVDLGLDDVDPGLAPEGARCGKSSLCVNQKCMPVASLVIGPQSCPNDCSGRGVCNSLGHCHCNEGWAPPDCLAPGPGGSVDSGPASSPDSSGISTILLAVICVIIPLIMIGLCLVFFLRGSDKLRWLHKSRQDSVGGVFIKVERRSSSRHSSRPPSRLNIDVKDISGPISVESTHSPASSSPTHALLPRSTTQTSEIGDANRNGGHDARQNNGDSSAGRVDSQDGSDSAGINSGDTSGNKFSFFSSGLIIGNLGNIGRKKSLSKEDSQPDSLTESEDGRKSGSGSVKSRTNNFIKAINKSISLPSAFSNGKLRAAGPYSKKSNSDSGSRYEVKIEPSKYGYDDQASPTVEHAPSIAETACVVEKTDMETPPPCYDQAVTPSGTGKNNTGKPSFAPPSVTSSATSVPPSSSYSAFMNSRNPTKASTLPPSMSLGQVPDTAKAGALPITKVDTKVTLERKKSGQEEAKTSPTTTTATASSASLDFRHNPKLAFPHSSSFSSPSARPIVGAPGVHSSLSSNSISSSRYPRGPVLSAINEQNNKAADKKPSNPASYINPNAIGSSTNSPPAFTTNIKPLQSPFFKKTSATSTTSGPTLPSSSTTTSSSPASLATTPSTVTTSSTSSVLSKASPLSISVDSSKKPSSVPASKTSKDSAEPANKKLGSTTKDLTSVAAGSPGTAATVTPSTTEGKEKESPVSAPPSTMTSTKPIISRPILQAATPNAASLIAKAPSTGVSQSSILAGGKDKEPDPFRPPREKGRRAVFCDPITLPSPTSPNNPPIIHQQHQLGGSGANAAGAQPAEIGATGSGAQPQASQTQLITPTWSVQPPATVATICHISGSSNSSNTKPVSGTTTGSSSRLTSPTKSVDVSGLIASTSPSMTSPVRSPTTDGPKSGLSKLISSVKRTPSMSVADAAAKEANKAGDSAHNKSASLPRKPKISGGSSATPPAKPDRNSLNIRGLEISNPILQSTVDSKLNLVPVCRSPDLEPVATNSEPASKQTKSGGQLTAPSSASSAGGSPSNKRPAPPPPGSKPQPEPKGKASTSSSGGDKTKPNDDIAAGTSTSSIKAKYSGVPWRSTSHRSTGGPARANFFSKDGSASTAADGTVTKSSSADLLDAGSKSSASSSPVKTGGAADSQATGGDSGGGAASRSGRRPASIATSKPIRPNAPPPKPPPTPRSGAGSKQTSPDEDIYIYDDATALSSSRSLSRRPSAAAKSTAPLANIEEAVGSPTHEEPIYDTISEVRQSSGHRTAMSPQSEEDFETPMGSPTVVKKSPDTLSTGSSAEEDLMKEILKEMHTKSEGESIYSSLMRKDKKKRRSKQ